ncbi:MAG TPA: efflux RND transporter periplasmic adaptor subunit [Vicinamibacterales bacterium]|nr:efflux RND transporter periplasmic adaptor subunit [Vicinamibacterales bacterium]
MLRLSAFVTVLFVGAAAAGPSANGGATLRLHGSVEPIRSYPVFVPRLSGSNVNSVVITHLAKAGTQVKKGDLLVEFDSQAQVKTAHDREAEYRDFVEQINKLRADQVTARAHDEAALKQAENAVRSAEIDVSTNELRARIDAEKNQLMLEEMRAHLTALRRTSDLRRKAEAADIRLLEIQRDRAKNAWTHAEHNATKMRIVSPLDGLVVLKTTWKNGSFGEVQEGEDTRPGVPIMDVVDSTAMRIRSRINQADIERMRVGQTATIILDSYPSREFHGTLEQLSPIASTSALSAKVRTFLAIFSVAEADPHLLPDLAAAIDVDVSRP